MTLMQVAFTIYLVRTQSIIIDVIDRESFLRYGDTIEVSHPDPGKARRGEDEYRILLRVGSDGWRVALHCVRMRWSDTLLSYESRRLLTPQQGSALLLVAPPERVQNVQLFILDRAVALNEGIPHRLLTLSLESWVEVAEGYDARFEEMKLRRMLVPAGAWD